MCLFLRLPVFCVQERNVVVHPFCRSNSYFLRHSYLPLKTHNPNETETPLEVATFVFQAPHGNIGAGAHREPCAGGCGADPGGSSGASGAPKPRHSAAFLVENARFVVSFDGGFGPRNMDFVGLPVGVPLPQQKKAPSKICNAHFPYLR